MMFAAVVALAAIAAGCGSSDDGTDTVDATITKNQLIAQGDRICKQSDKEIEAGAERYAEENGIAKDEEPNKEQSVELIETVVVPKIRSQSESIRALGAPAGDEEEIEAMLDSLDQAVEEAEDNPGSLLNDGDPFADAVGKARDYGFKVCGQG